MHFQIHVIQTLGTGHYLSRGGGGGLVQLGGGPPFFMHGLKGGH